MSGDCILFSQCGTERFYRAARSMAPRATKIANLAGEQFDSQAVRAFLTTPDSLWESLRREVNSPLRGRFTAQLTDLAAHVRAGRI